MNVLVDTSVFIRKFRSQGQSRELLDELATGGDTLYVSTITVFELLAGTSKSVRNPNRQLLSDTIVLDVNELIAERAVVMHDQLQRDRFRLHVADALIAATALSYDLPLATLNTRHFERVPGLRLYAPPP